MEGIVLTILLIKNGVIDFTFEGSEWVDHLYIYEVYYSNILKYCIDLFNIKRFDLSHFSLLRITQEQI